MSKIPRNKLLPKILIAIPTYDAKNYCLEAFIDNIRNFTYPKDRIDIFIADNSKDNKNALMINKKYGIKTFWKDYSGMGVMEKLADSHNQLRRFFLDGEYDYMFHLESDIFPPKDIIEQLLWCRKPIVNGLYQVFDASWRSPCIALQDDKHELSDSFVFHTTLDNFHHFWTDGTLKKTFIAGIGCCLMKRKVMKNFKFRWDRNEPKPPDTWFAEDLRNAGIQNWVHTGQLCFHWNREDWGRHFEYMQYEKSE
jgi:cellulose synthase/poly-beta-1,6-N-acetylglucosamine synthase-like glycosyltransferase